jgi:hypothetical protein
MKVTGGIQTMPQGETAGVESRVRFTGTNGKTYQLNFSGQNRTSLVGVTHPDDATWVIETPPNPAVRLFEVAKSGKLIEIGLYNFDFKMTITRRP